VESLFLFLGEVGGQVCGLLPHSSEKRVVVAEDLDNAKSSERGLRKGGDYLKNMQK